MRFARARNRCGYGIQKSSDGKDWVDGVTVTNDVAYTGFLMHVYGYLNEKITASGGPSHNGGNQSSGVVEFPIKRSGSITFDPGAFSIRLAG